MGTTKREFQRHRLTSPFCQQLVNSLTTTDYNVNIGVLETAHSIFRPWRSQVRTDALFTTINFVLGRFIHPFLHLIRHTSSLLLSSSGDVQQRQLAAQSMRSLVEIFYDLVSQDLPPDIEDAHLEFWNPEGGIFLSFLAWDPVEMRGDVSRMFFSDMLHIESCLQPDDNTPSVPSQIKTAILEIAEVREGDVNFSFLNSLYAAIHQSLS